MNVTEMGNIADSMSDDIVVEVSNRIKDREEKFEFDWYGTDAKETVLGFVKDALKKRLPEVGYVIEATKDEVRGLDFNAFAVPVTLAKLEKPTISTDEYHRRLGKWLTESLEKFSKEQMDKEVEG